MPAHLIGRVVTSTQIVNHGTMPLAGVAAGWLGASIGISATMLAMAAIHALACCPVLASPLRRVTELPRAGSR